MYAIRSYYVAAPVFVLGPIGIIIGPLTYGFLLAAFRTRKIIKASSVQPGSSIAGSPEDSAGSPREKSTETPAGRSVERPVQASGERSRSGN